MNPTLKPFRPPAYVVAIYRHGTREVKCIGRTRTENFTRLAGVVEFDHVSSADNYAAEALSNYPEGTTSVKVRRPTVADLAKIRADEITAHLSEYVGHILNQEQDNLNYCLDEDGNYIPDIAEALIAAVKESIELTLNPDDQDPVRMGWVGSDGLP